MRHRRDGTLGIPSQLGRVLSLLSNHIRNTFIESCCFPFHATSSRRTKAVNMPLSTSLICSPYSLSWLVHVSCRQRGGLLSSWRIRLGRTPLHRKMHPVTCYKNLLCGHLHGLHAFPTEWLEWSGNTVADFSKK